MNFLFLDKTAKFETKTEAKKLKFKFESSVRRATKIVDTT